MSAPDEPQVFEIGDFRLDAAKRTLLAADGTRVPVSSRPFELLLFFARHPGELLDKDRLIKAVWPDTVVEENNLNQSIGALRKALGESPGDRKFLVTEPGRGYRFVAPVRVVSGVPAAAPPITTEPEAARATPARDHRLLIVVALGIVLVGAGVLLWSMRMPTVTDRSIAVLPFENRSEARENGYLALGIQDEILTLLTRIESLRVVPRASTVKFENSRATASDISRELGVSYLLQGAVQRSGDRIRVNVTLIDAGLDRQLWASSYERSASEVFAVESEVARDVATVLQARLTVKERKLIAQPPTAVAAAYDSYLRAKALAERTTRTEAEIHAAIAAYEAAVRLDPDFAIAWAQLSRRHANLYSLSYDRSADRRDKAQRALERALSLRPDLLETQIARGYFMFVVEGDLESAESAFRALEAKYPASADATAGLAQILRQRGLQELSDDYARRTLALDPHNPYRHAIICQDYLTAREIDVAAMTCARAIELLPGDAGILALQATIHQARGELDVSRVLLRSLIPAPGDWRSLRVMSRQLLLDHDSAAAVKLLASYLANADALGTRRGVVRRWLGDAQRLAGENGAAQDSYRRSREDLEAELRRQPENPLLVAELAIVQARLGNRDAGVELSQRCAQLAASARRDAFTAECALADIQVELATGTPAGAVARVKKMLTVRGALPPLTPALLRLDPELTPLRSREDFKALL